MAISITPISEGTPIARSVRELLDDAQRAEPVDTEMARAMAHQARVLARTLNDVVGESEALLCMATIAYEARTADEAFHVALDAREHARHHGVGSVEVRATNLVALIQFDAGNLTEALEAASQAIDLHRINGLVSSEGPLLNTAAMIHAELGDVDRALVTYEAALLANKSFVRPDHDLATMANLAELRAARGEHLLAVSLGESALELARVHQPARVARVLVNLARSYGALGAAHQADSCLTEAERFAQRDAEPAHRHWVLSSVALVRVELAHGAGRADEAIDQAVHALSLVGDGSLDETAAQAHGWLSRLYREQGRFETALTHAEAQYNCERLLALAAAERRIRTLQMANELEAARRQAEIVRFRTAEYSATAARHAHDPIIEPGADIESYQLEAFQRLAVIAEFRDTDTGEHTIRVGDLAAELAAELGETEQFVTRLRLAGRLHDIGKVAVPDSILLKPGPLTVDEFEVMKTHTTVGAEILSGSSSPLLQLAAEVALTHHERWDGSGYPNGLPGETIPLSGRIVTVADVFDALTSERVYKRAWSLAEATRYVIAGSGAQFEPRIVSAFIDIVMRRHPTLAAELNATAE
jgi:putative two-component system response regulator